MNYELAKSLSGHDRDQIYLIWKKEGRFAYLVDGKAHTLANPKKKNEKHYQAVKHIPEHIILRLNETGRCLTMRYAGQSKHMDDQSISRRL